MVGRYLAGMGTGFETSTTAIFQAEVCSYTAADYYTSHESFVPLRPKILIKYSSTCTNVYIADLDIKFPISRPNFDNIEY